MMKLDGEKGWAKPGRVREVHSPRSYIIETDGGGCLRRNRRHLQSRPGAHQSGDDSSGAARIGVGPSSAQDFDAARQAVGPKHGGIIEAARPGVDDHSRGFNEATRPAVEPNLNDPDLDIIPPDGDLSVNLGPAPPVEDAEPRRSGRTRTKPKYLKDYVQN